MNLKIVIHGTELTATLIDSETSKDFVSLLPLTLKMNDLFGREKFGHLPRPISSDGPKTHAYDVGDIAYWSPGPDVAIFYLHDGQAIPDPGLTVIATLDSGVERLDVPGRVTMTLDVDAPAT